MTFSIVAGPVSHGTCVKQKAKAARSVQAVHEDAYPQCDAQQGFASVTGSKVASSTIVVTCTDQIPVAEAADGADVGSVVGCLDGLVVGCPLGRLDGSLEGKLVGASVAEEHL